ncbi:MAG: hypothetical protein DDG60_03010 [Anaerolineae bacterium]|nr:MAG: hypothetical protein DDG60_03010 [Anaerolineae bacterium]
MFSSLRSRLWLTYALLIGVALFVVATAFLVYVIRNPLASRQARIQLNTVQTILLARRNEWENLPLERLRTLLIRQGKQLETRILLLDEKRQVLVDSQPLSLALDLSRLTRLNQTTYDSQGNPWLFKTQRLENGNILVLAVPRPQPPLLALLKDEILPPLMIGGFAALALSLWLAFWLARWIADPLQQLVNAARSFSGQNAPTLPVTGPHEVRAVLHAFNQMTTRVQAGQKAQREFVANVSHELKTPLTSIQGFAQAILDGTADTPEAQRQAAQIIYDESARLHRLALDLLDLARLDSGLADFKHDPLDLNALARSAAERFERRAQAAGVQLHLQLTPLPSLAGDGDRLAQVLDNLLDNALKFTPAGGQVTLSTLQRGETIELRIQDNGAGIPPQALPHIFERFYQADPSRQNSKSHGAGLGLSIAKEIITAHGGTISAQSTPGQGSLFTVHLPVPGR